MFDRAHLGPILDCLSTRTLERSSDGDQSVQRDVHRVTRRRMPRATDGYEALGSPSVCRAAHAWGCFSGGQVHGVVCCGFLHPALPRKPGEGPITPPRKSRELVFGRSRFRPMHASAYWIGVQRALGSAVSDRWLAAWHHHCRCRKLEQQVPRGHAARSSAGVAAPTRSVSARWMVSGPTFWGRRHRRADAHSPSRRMQGLLRSRGGSRQFRQHADQRYLESR
jgi:hypothetical protein